MKYFITGLTLAIMLGVGISVVAISFDPAQTSAGEIAKDCTWSDVKDCFSDGGANPNNPCCPPKANMQIAGSDAVSNLELEGEIAKNCTWDQVKLCYLYGAHINNPCCPPKVNVDMPIAMDQSECGEDTLVRNCTLSQVKDCYSGDPNPNNPCCPPKAMEEAISKAEFSDNLAKNCTWTEVKLCYAGVPNRCCPPKMHMS